MEHKLILGGEQYLPFARSRIRALRAIGLTHAVQRFDIDGVTVCVRITGDQSFIELRGGEQPGYQFFSTGVEITDDVGNFGFPVYYGYALGTNKRGASKALASSLESSVPGASKQWAFTSPPEGITLEFPRKNLWQLEGISQHAFYPKVGNKLDADTLLVSSWCCADPLQSLSVFGGEPYNRSRFDVTYDSAPCLFRKGDDTPEGYSGLASDSDWYKRAALRTVTHPVYGSRQFIVMSDIFGTFHAYPTGQVDETLIDAAEAAYPGQAIKTNVAEVFVKRQVAPWPAWCRQPLVSARDTYTGDINAYLLQVPQYRWAFNSAATRACSVVFEDLPALAMNDPASTKPYRIGAGDAHFDLQESLSGLLELDINLELTGSNPEDFSFSLSTRQALRPSVTQQYIMMADYAWEDKVDKAAPFAALDDLLLMTGSIYHTSTERNYSGGDELDIDALKSLLTVINQTQDQVIRTFVAHTTNQPYLRSFGENGLPDIGLPLEEADTFILAADLRIMAFVVQQRFVEESFLARPGINGGFPFNSQVSQTVQRIRVYAYNKLDSEILMDEDSPLNTKLEAAHDNFSVTGRFKYPLNDVGVIPVTNTSVYGASGFPRMGGRLAPHYINTLFQQNNYGGSFQAGAYLYATRLATALQLNHRDRFAVHPSGSWSITTNPIFYYGGRVSMYRPWDEVGYGVDVSKMKQTSVDIINIKTAKGVKRTTHLAAFNTAFGKSLTREDFRCTFSLFIDRFNWYDATVPTAGKSVGIYIKALTPADATSYIGIDMYSTETNEAEQETSFRYRPNTPPANRLPMLGRADARVLQDYVFSTPPLITNFTGSLEYSYQLFAANPEFEPLHDHTAVLNGNTLFY